MQRRVTSVVHGADIGAEFGQKMHRRHPGIGCVLRKVPPPTNTGSDHQGRRPAERRHVGIRAGRQQQSHGLDIAGLRRAPERSRAGGVDPQSVVRRRTEPQSPRDTGIRISTRVEQRRQECQRIDHFLVGSWIWGPRHRREPHVDGGVEGRQTIDVHHVRIGAGIQKILRDGVVPIRDGDHQRARPLAAGDLIDVRAALDECTRRLQMAVPRRKEQGGHSAHDRVGSRCPWTAPRQLVAVAVEPSLVHRHHQRCEPHVGAMPDEQPDRVGAVFPGGEHQGGLSVRGLSSIHKRPVIKQPSDRVNPSRRGRRHQRSGTGRCRPVHESPSLLKQIDHPHTAVARGHRHRRNRTNTGGGSHVGVSFDEHTGQVDVVTKCRPVESRHPVALRSVDVATAREERTDPLGITGHGRVGDRRVDGPSRHRLGR